MMRSLLWKRGIALKRKVGYGGSIILLLSCATVDVEKKPPPKTAQDYKKEMIRGPKAAFKRKPFQKQMAAQVAPKTMMTSSSLDSVSLVVLFVSGFCIMGLILGVISGGIVGGAKWALGSGTLLAIGGAILGAYIYQKLFPAAETSSLISSSSECGDQST